MRTAASLFVIVCSAGCPSLGSYECASPADCDRAGEGECLPDGACAYPDDNCESGLRRSPNAPTAAGQCTNTAATTIATAVGTSTAPSNSATSLTTTTGETGPAQCGFEKPITIDTTLLSAVESLSGYPFLVSVTDGDLAGDSEFFFFDEDGTHLPHDLERYDAGTGEVLAWVRLPGWELGIPKTIVIRYGDLASPPTNLPTSVWADNFLGVWHMSPELTGVDDELVRDATTNGEHGVTRGAMGAGQVVPAIVGSGLMFDGDDDKVEIAASFRGTLESFTISGWVRDDSDGTIHAPFFSRLNGDDLFPRCRKVADTAGVRCQIAVDESETLISAGASGEVLPYETWGHLALTFDASTSHAEFFMGGELVGEDDGVVGTLRTGDFTVYFGFLDEFNTMLGQLDEMRLAPTVVNTEWIKADARIHRAPDDAIVSVGSAEALPCD